MEPSRLHHKLEHMLYLVFDDITPKEAVERYVNVNMGSHGVLPPLPNPLADTEKLFSRMSAIAQTHGSISSCWRRFGKRRTQRKDST